MQTILLTGGLGYIGSHTVVSLFEYLASQNFMVFNVEVTLLIIDDLSNCTISVLAKIKEVLKLSQISEELIEQKLSFELLDVRNYSDMKNLFEKRRSELNPINYIIHFAGKKAVGEALKEPLLYYETNFIGSFNLVKLMSEYDCKHFLFSSTATVYGNSDNCQETSPILPLHPYSETKVCVEYLMRSYANSKPESSMISLRYFNPCGAHTSYLIGDSPSVYPNNLFPFIEQVAIGKRPKLFVFGNDFQTCDGTGVRDYIHIMDLAEAHVAAFKKFCELKQYQTFNIGTGKGRSVLEIVQAYSQAIGKQIDYEIIGRRPGDVDVLQAKVTKAEEMLGWKCKKSLQDMCVDSYSFITKNSENTN